MHTTLSLNGTWSVAPTALDGTLSDDAAWLPAAVPGEIHVDLMRAGMMEEPSFGDNARRCRWPEERAWWYRTTFQADATFRAHERQTLTFDGIDLFGQVYLNGVLLGESRNAFTSAVFDVKKALRDGENELVVRVTAGTELVVPEERGNGFSGLYDVRNFWSRRLLRKPQYVYGWDWNDPLPNVGLWRGVRVEGHSGVALRDFRLDTVIAGEDVSLVGEAILENLHPWAERECALVITLTTPDGTPITVTRDLRLQMGLSVVALKIAVPEPQLWWPNGMGAQALYGVTVQVLQGDDECDRREQTVGLRTVEIDRAPLADGTRFCVRVNGQEVFCKGGNWAPADMIAARIPAERYEALVAEAANAHFTMFRVNGIGLYEGDAFYDACDRAGILLWQDFDFACAEYPDHDPAFRALVRDEVEATVRRLRHHPALALWCGCNESIWGITAWLQSDLSDLDTLGGIRLYGQVLPEAIHRLDPVRPYWPCSPYGGAMPNEEQHGNCHWWFPYTMNPDMERRIRPEVVDECRARFVSEYGVIGPPHLDSVREYLPAAAMTVGSIPWQIHTNTFERGTLAEGIRRHYVEPEGLTLPDYLLYGQLFQAIMQGEAMEALRFRKGDADAECWGALIWSYNDCWGEVGWSVIDHYLRRKASYYRLRAACTPVKVITRWRDGGLLTRVINDTRQAYDAEVEHGWFALDGRERRLATTAVRVPANGMVEIARATIPADLDPRAWLYGALLRGDGLADQDIRTLRPYRELATRAPQLTITDHGDAITVVSPVYCHAVHIEDGGHELLVDNFFDLLPGVPRRVAAKGTVKAMKTLGVGENIGA